MSRVTVTEDEFGGLRVAIAPYRDPYLALFLGLLLLIWAILAISLPLLASMGMVRDKNGQSSLPIVSIVWLGWLLVGKVLFYLFGLNLFGTESLILGDEALEFTTKVGPFVRSRKIDWEDARNLRYAPPQVNRAPWSGAEKWEQILASLGIAGAIALDDGAKTHRFGAGLSETDSKRLILTIQKSFPIEEEPLQPFPITR